MTNSKEVSISAASVSDQAASKDALGFDPYVIAIADFLTESETKPPLTLSVEGAWGSGKSSFMKQLEREIRRQSKEKIRSKLRKERTKHIGLFLPLIYTSRLRKKENRPKGTRELKFIRNIRRKFRQKPKLNEFAGNLVGLRQEIFKSIAFDFDSFKELLINLIKLLINLIILFILFIRIPLFVFLVLIHLLVNSWKIVALTYKIWFPHQPRMVWFNAWRHDNANALWAAFALTFLEEISKKRHWLDIFPPLCGHIKLFLFRFQQKEGGLDFLRTLLQVLLAIFAIVLILLFTFSPNSKWVNDLSSQVQQYTPPIVSTSSPSPSPSPTPSPTPSSSPSPSSPAASSPTPSPSPTSSPTPPPSEITNFLSNLPSWLSKLPFWGAGSLAVLSLWQQLQKIVGDPKKDLKEYLKAPKYDDEVSFIEKFHKDFKKIVNAYAGKGKKVYVFIDDLDRCDVPKSAELMQAINLMISNDPQLIFILGMDREKVAAGLAVKHKEVIPYLFSSVQAQSEKTQGNQDSLKGIEYGYMFIEKFIQLPFQVPRPAKEQFDQFVVNLSSSEQPQDSIWQAMGNFFWKPIQKNSQRLIRWISPQNQNRKKPSGDVSKTQTQTGATNVVQQQVEQRLERLKLKTGSDSPEIHNILEMVAPALDWNPRRLKQFLNLFRLRAYIASATGLFDQIGESSALTLEQLGKFTAIGIKWPLLMVELMKDEDLLSNLQKCVPTSKSMTAQQPTGAVNRSSWNCSLTEPLVRIFSQMNH